MPLQTCWATDPCDSCGSEEAPLLVMATIGTTVASSIILCARCRIELEATLRAARKGGPRILKGG